jgi:hypothetical protein
VKEQDQGTARMEDWMDTLAASPIVRWTARNVNSALSQLRKRVRVGFVGGTVSARVLLVSFSLLWQQLRELAAWQRMINAYGLVFVMILLVRFLTVPLLSNLKEDQGAELWWWSKYVQNHPVEVKDASLVLGASLALERL